MSLKGLPVGLRPHCVGIGSNSTHLVYPSSEQGKFILEELDSGDNHTLDATNTTPVKFAFGKHAVALLTRTNVLFWSLADGAPLESWDSEVKDVWAEYGNWVLEGPNISFDPVLQESKHVSIDKPAPQSYKYQPVFVDKQGRLQVGQNQFDLGGIETLATVQEYIVASKGSIIKVLYNLQEIGSVEVDEAVLALTAAVVDDELHAYCVTATKVAQFVLDLDFETTETQHAAESQADTESILYSGWFQQVEQGTRQPVPEQPVPEQPVPEQPVPEKPSSRGSQDLLAMLHGNLPPTTAPSTSSVTGPSPGSMTPVQLPELDSSEELLSLIKKPAHAFTNKAALKHKDQDTSDYVSREYFDSTVGTLKNEIEQLKLEIQRLGGSPASGATPSAGAQGTSVKPALSASTTPKAESKPKGSPKGPLTGSTPASVADAISRTMQGERHLQFLESKLSELKFHLDNAPHEKAQLLKLVLIDAYHHTKLSKTLMDSFGTPTIDPNLYNSIVGEETRASS